MTSAPNALDLVDQLVGRARPEAHLHLSHPERGVLAEHVGQLLRRPGEGVRSRRPSRVADVHRPDQPTDVDRVVAPAAARRCSSG